nr:hypothetical protein GTC16762_29160 [Pigmentibacter ruber]
MRIFSFYFWVLQLPLVVIFFFFVWFIPWVFVLHLGFLIYFPYKEDGLTRFFRITGPVIGIFSKTWVNKKEIPNACKAALIASEDGKFYQHNGIDIESIQKIVKDKSKATKQKRGGSTITQQLVKNAFLSRDRSYIRKTRELIGAILLDATIAKDKQIEWYLNIVEFGPNTYGLENAAQRYFKIDAKKLSPSQCVALIAILPSPKKWNQSLEKKKLTQFFIQRYRQISNNIIEMHIASRKEKIDIKQMNLGFSYKKENLPQQFEPVPPPEATENKNAQNSSEEEQIKIDSTDKFKDNSQIEGQVKDTTPSGVDSDESLNDIENSDE